MRRNLSRANKEVTDFLDQQTHPLRAVIEELRMIILSSDEMLSENIKWNGPNYCYKNEDRITMKIHPPKNIQLIFHRGAKKLTQPNQRLINDDSGLLTWRENDRAIAGFKNLAEVATNSTSLVSIIKKWIGATAAG